MKTQNNKHILRALLETNSPHCPCIGLFFRNYNPVCTLFLFCFVFMTMKIMNCPCGYSFVLFFYFLFFQYLPSTTLSSRLPSVVKNQLANAGDAGSVPGSGRSPGEGNGNPLQYSCLDNPLDRGAWQAIVHGVTKEPDTTQPLNNKTPSSIIVPI